MYLLKRVKSVPLVLKTIIFGDFKLTYTKGSIRYAKDFFIPISTSAQDKIACLSIFNSKINIT